MCPSVAAQGPSRRLRRSALAMLVCLAALVMPALARAEVGWVTLGFDDVVAGTRLTDEYAAHGVIFGPTPAYPNELGPVVRANAAATSAPNLATTGRVSGTEFKSRWAHTGGRFTETRQTVAFQGIDTGDGCPPWSWKVVLMDATGATVATKQVNVFAGVTTQPVSASAPQRNVVFFHIEAGTPTPWSCPEATSSGIDDLRFDTTALTPPGRGWGGSGGGQPPPPAPAPGLTIMRLDGTRPIGVLRGSSAKVPLQMYRFNGSTGDVTFAAQGLPAGVSATFDPPVASQATEPQVTMTITAAQGVAQLNEVPVTVTATGPASAGTVSPATVLLTTQYDAGVRVVDMEVTQGLQDPQSLVKVGDQRYRYEGIGLARGKRTVVRVYGESFGAPPSGLPDVRAYLRAWRGDQELGTIAAANNPRTLTDAYTLDDDRLLPGGAFNFSLPPEWTKGTVRLTAELYGGAAAPGIDEVSPFVKCTTPLCDRLKVMTVEGVAFTPVRRWTIETVLVHWWTSIPPFDLPADVRPSAPETVFGAARVVTPLGEDTLVIRPYSAVIDITDIAHGPGTNGDDWRNYQVFYRLRSYVETRFDPAYAYPNAPGDIIVGVNRGHFPGIAPARGLTSNLSGFELWPPKPGENHPYAVVAQERAFTSVAHELYHDYGYAMWGGAIPHASAGCGAVGDQQGEDWPDPEGRMVGLALDTREGSGGGPGLYRVLGAGVPGATADMFDLMSYCAREWNSWISRRNWDRVLEWRRAGQAGQEAARRSVALSAGASTQRLLVSASVLPDGSASIASVVPVRGVATAPPASDYHAIVLDAAGAVIADVPMAAGRAHMEGSPDLVVLSASVPGAGAAAIRILRAGTEIASRARSAGVPRVRFLEPRSGQRVGGRRPVAVRWRATDADGDPLVVRLDYQGGGGRWRNIYAGPSTGRTTLPARLLPTARSARLRLAVNDGFNQTTVTSARFRALGAPPEGTITSPVRGARLNADATVALAGSAFDEDGNPLRGRALRWYAGPRLLGTGVQAAAPGLPVGTLRITLVARDRRGRTAAAGVPVRVLPTTPTFLVLRATGRSGARVLRLRVASTFPATLLVAGRRYAVDRRVRTLAVPLRRPLRRPGTVAVALSAGPRTSRTAVRIG